MKRNWIRKIIGGLSFTSAVFVFQACYGAPQDLSQDISVEGLVKSKSSGLPLPGIKVSVISNGQYQLTDTSGRFHFYTALQKDLKLRFEDIDSTANGSYVDKDTLLSNVSNTVYLEMNLEDK